jgi:hypothetical protein
MPATSFNGALRQSARMMRRELPQDLGDGTLEALVGVGYMDKVKA